MKNNNPYIIGLFAAAAFIAMMVIFTRMGVMVLVPVLFGALPIYIAALGWGTIAGVVATVIVAIVTAVTSGAAGGLMIAMIIAAPAALAGHQANLAQQLSEDDEDLAWYPLSRILFWITILVAAAVLVFGLMMDFNPDKLGAQLAEQLKTMLPTSDNGPSLSQDELSLIMTQNLKILPFMLPSLWIGIHMMNLVLGMRITRKLGVLARPHENVAAELNMPQFALGLMVVTLVGMGVTSAPISYVFAVMSGALVMAFSIVGLANFHLSIANWSARTPLLVLTYGVIAILFFPVYLFSIAGVLRASRIPKKQDYEN